jgi:superfamily II DNA or RNA helicase
MSYSNLELINGLQTGFVDKQIVSQNDFVPKILLNDKVEGKKVLSSLINELNGCSEFWFSVAFVTAGGVASLKNTLEEMANRKIKGKILVSQYLNFTQPEALRQLLKFKNIELRISVNTNFHAKGYLFKKYDYYNLIIGSSNLTGDALSTNKELNIKTSATENSFIINKIKEEFNNDFINSVIVDDEYIKSYEELYKNSKYRTIYQKPDFGNIIKPNLMQNDALRNLVNIRANGKNKALLISATGTGKTYLSAFDVKAVEAKTFLFIVHRGNIANKAMETFKSIFGTTRSLGVFSGNKKELGADFLFSTVQTISKPENLELFNKDHFDYIVIDETHRAGAESYKRVLDYFKPDFLLGMTATPERTDGHDIFKYFDYNIAYEIRLHKALEEEMLSPFHYYGVTDISVNGQIIDDNAAFDSLTSNERLDKIIEKSSFYGCDSGDVRGLVFCSKVEECKILAAEFTKRGLPSIYLSGENTEVERSNAIEQLESDNKEEKIQYIFSVDIFNEGVDIPRVNQIIMLRPTQSAIIFVQQLGRGLRKTDGKEYLTVIDFIGNYNNNFLVPIALYGDSSYNKDTIRKLMTSGSDLIPGQSTINFDRITRERIYAAIDTANLSKKKDLVKDYELLKYKLGRIPTMVDFLEHGSRDPELFVDYNKSYYNFIKGTDSNVSYTLSPRHSKILELFSNEINNAIRVEESIILMHLIEQGSLKIARLKQIIFSRFGYNLTEETITSAINNLNFNFVTENYNKELLPVSEIHKLSVINKIEDELFLSNSFIETLLDVNFKSHLIDNTNYSILKFERLFGLKKYVGGFVLYNKYSRKDVFRILNWDKNPLAQNVGGYMFNPERTNCAIFVNYHKDDDISSTTKYEEGFLNKLEFEWMSKSKRTLTSPDIISLKNGGNKLRLPLFIKKSNDEGAAFYYMGDVVPIQESFKQANIKDDANNNVSVVKVKFRLNTPVDDALYNYITNSQE